MIWVNPYVHLYAFDLIRKSLKKKINKIITWGHSKFDFLHPSEFRQYEIGYRTFARCFWRLNGSGSKYQIKLMKSKNMEYLGKCMGHTDSDNHLKNLNKDEKELLRYNCLNEVYKNID